MSAARPLRLGRYELVSELARGGMADVYVARLVGASGFVRPVAIKRMLPHLARDPQFAAMFVEEAKVVARLAHANICQVLELGDEDGELYIVMELLDGVAWDAVMRQAPLDPPLVAGVLAQAAEGLHHAHQLPVIHRDVSPQNLFVTRDGVCKVLDFGVAKLADGTRTRTGVLKGKLPYMSPEQLRGEPLDARADVFALGVVAWESLAGAPLFHRDTDFLVWKAIDEEPIPTLTSRRPALPRAIDDVVLQALARDRAARFESTRAFTAALAGVAGALAPADIAIALRDAFGAPPDVAREPSAASTVDERPPSVALRRDAITVVPAPRPRRRRTLAIAGAIVAIAGAAVTVAIVATRGADETADRTQPAPPPAPPAPPAPPPPVSDEGGLITREQAAQIDQATAVLETLGGSGHRADLDQLRKLRNLAPRARGTITIESDAPATIYIDGELAGDAPIVRRPIATGTHHVRAVSNGRTRELDVAVAAQREVVAPKLAW